MVTIRGGLCEDNHGLRASLIYFASTISAAIFVDKESTNCLSWTNIYMVLEFVTGRELFDNIMNIEK